MDYNFLVLLLVILLISVGKYSHRFYILKDTFATYCSGPQLVDIGLKMDKYPGVVLKKENVRISLSIQAPFSILFNLYT
jgi:hypothetical protein